MWISLETLVFICVGIIVYFEKKSEVFALHLLFETHGKCHINFCHQDLFKVYGSAADYSEIFIIPTKIVDHL